MTPLRVVRLLTVAICVVGIAGMIAGSLADNNNGAVVTFGLLAAVASLVLMAVAATTRATTGPSMSSNTSEMNGLRGVLVGCRRFQRSTLSASARSCW